MAEGAFFWVPSSPGRLNETQPPPNNAGVHLPTKRLHVAVAALPHVSHGGADTLLLAWVAGALLVWCVSITLLLAAAAAAVSVSLISYAHHNLRSWGLLLRARCAQALTHQ